MTVVTEKNKWMDLDRWWRTGNGVGPIHDCLIYLRAELGDRMEIYWVEKLPPKYPK